jgi:hypothetical protein
MMKRSVVINTQRNEQTASPQFWAELRVVESTAFECHRNVTPTMEVTIAKLPLNKYTLENEIIIFNIACTEETSST